MNHSENKNERLEFPPGTFYVHNGINLGDPAGPDTSPGYTPGVGRRDYERGYLGLVSMSCAPLTPGNRYGMILNKHDMGPILLPWTGFLTDDGKERHLLYRNPHPHPSSLVAEDPKDGEKYVDVLYLEAATNPGAERTMAAARAPLGSGAIAGSFLNFYRGDCAVPSLFATMKDEPAIPLARRGGRCDSVLPSLNGIQDRLNPFFVPRLKRSGVFLSIQTYPTGEEDGWVEWALRLSQDLPSGTERFVLPNSRVAYRQCRSKEPPFGLCYAKFLSADALSHYAIDEASLCTSLRPSHVR